MKAGEDVTDYIEHNILSFGQLPEGWSPVGLHFYENNQKSGSNGRIKYLQS